MESEILLDVHGVRRSFPKAGGGELLVLDAVELRLVNGEIVGLLGRSGSGKSTLLRIISGLSKPTAGSVVWITSPSFTARSMKARTCGERSDS